MRLRLLLVWLGVLAGGAAAADTSVTFNREEPATDRSPRRRHDASDPDGHPDLNQEPRS